MNYLKEINLFYDWLETHSVSDSVIVLWHALMHINNKTGWKVEFAVAISTLEVKTGLKKSAIQRARQTLKDMGRIDFTSRKGNQAAMYKMISLEHEFLKGLTNTYDTQNNFVALKEPQSVPQTVPQSVPQTVPQSVPINKLNYTKPNYTSSSSSKEEEEDNDHTPTEAIRFYEGNISKLKPYEKSLLYNLVERYGDDLVIHASKAAIENGATSMKYIEVVLEDWRNKNLSTVEKVIEHEEEWRKNKKPSNVTPISKNKSFTSMYSHNWDLDELETRASEYMEKTLYGGE